MKNNGENMEEQKPMKVKLSTVIIIIFILLLILAAGIYAVKSYYDKLMKFVNEGDYQSQIDNLNKTLNELQDKLDDLGNTSFEIETTTETLNPILDNNDDDNVTYKISIEDESKATINATKNGKTISKTFDQMAVIDKIDTIELPIIGKVAAVTCTGGEAYDVNVYQLVDNEIINLGKIDCGADMVKEATYTVNTNEDGVINISAYRDNEIKMNAIENGDLSTSTYVVDLLDLGKVVLIYYLDENQKFIDVYRLSQDYVTGETQKITSVGSLKLYK